eukprot:CAMPEP_0117430740 /NCGR_PEP_ID=MMETSP0758-20121206/10293_1 /TAXON_ID=63605 /ORGANISM="Percolomonas cosmopolitus, Strain AE-1 (ATCC 50343)" /LENGTH=89 /DNA_ID=CAMNT_0005219089 /DNA_START=1051 /DNA_END=1317 /DNA_ORIENTATION=-
MELLDENQLSDLSDDEAPLPLEKPDHLLKKPKSPHSKKAKKRLKKKKKNIKKGMSVKDYLAKQKQQKSEQSWFSSLFWPESNQQQIGSS